MDKRERIVKRVARELRDGDYINLGIGMPTLVANYVPPGVDITLHSENGMLGVGPFPTEDHLDPDLINAGKETVTELPGTSYFSSADSFAMVRGGHIDLTVLGAFQVSSQGDLANWDTGAPDAIPAVGGAMDLVVGARQVFVVMEHVSKTGEPKIVTECTYPLTGARVVDRIYTDCAVIDVTAQGLTVRWICEGLSFERLQAMTAAPLLPGIG